MGFFIGTSAAMAVPTLYGARFLMRCGGFERTPQDAVELAKETRAVLRRKTGVVALALAGLAQMLLQVTHRHRHADGFGRERAAGGAEHMRAERHRAGGKRDIVRDHDIV